MKSHIFLALPVVATLLNVGVAVLLSLFKKSGAQPVIAERLSTVRCDASAADRVLSDVEDYFTDRIPVDHEETKATFAEFDGDEPYLRPMPGSNFKAYVRPDVATYYREEPGSRMEAKPKFSGQAGKFVNMSPDHVSLWWDGPDGAVFNDNLAPWQSGGTACFPGHKFIFTKPGKPDQILCRMTVVPGLSVYYCDPFADEKTHPLADPQAKGIQYMGPSRSLESLSSDDLAKYEQLKYNLHFAALYKNFTGSEWLTQYPRNPPKHKIWRADYFGQEHEITTKETQFVALPEQSLLQKLPRMGMRYHDEPALQEYRAPGEMNITIKAVSCMPRAFEVRDFLSDVEADHILSIVARKRLERSTTNGHVSSTRTSSTTWIPRHTDPIVDAVFRRVADVLRMNEALLRAREPDELATYPTMDQINEDLQIVHYGPGQQYTAHHDFGYPKMVHPDSPSRSINFCMYLKDVEEGGETSFPRWRNAETGEPLNVKPEKGKAMIFYMVNPDGNLEDLTHHAALPVIKGEKYFSNLWIHDPVRL